MSEQYFSKFHDKNISWAIVKCDFKVLNDIEKKVFFDNKALQ